MAPSPEGTGRLWVSHLDNQERAALRETEEWLLAPPSFVGRSMQVLGRPFGFAFGRLPAGFRDGVSERVLKVLQGVQAGSEGTFNRKRLMDTLSAAVGADITRPEMLFDHRFEDLDPIVDELRKSYQRAALVEGGATGAVGLPGLLIDVPALYLMIFRQVSQIATCYGFDTTREEETAYLFKVVDVGHYLDSADKRRGMLDLETLSSLIRQGVPLQDLERTVLAKGLQALAQKLTATLVQRKMAQAVAVVGAAVGAGVNRQLVTDIGLTAFHAYRRRFLREAAALRDPSIGSAAGAQRQ